MARLEDAIKKLIAVRKKLATDQGRIARRNARRAVLGALRAVRCAIDSEYPKMPKAKSPEDWLTRDSKRAHWRWFEYTHARVRREWNQKDAAAFNARYAAMIGVQPKPIAFDIRDGLRVLGRHCRDRIRIAQGLTSQQRWEVLFHEIAHYRVRHHRRAFVIELANVIRAWREFVAEQHAAARS